MVQTPLHVASGNNNVEIVKFLLEWKGSEKVELEAKNMVIICWCMINSNICFFILEISLSIFFSNYNIFLTCKLSRFFSLVVRQYGETPLHMAAKNGSNEAAKLLLEKCAFVEAKANVKSFYLNL